MLLMREGTLLKTVRARVLPAIWPALIGLLLALGLLLPVLRVLSVNAAGNAVWACLLTAAVCFASGFGGRYQWAVLGAGALVLFAALAVSGVLSSLGGLVGAAVELLRGNAESLREYGPEVATIAGILLTLGGWGMARQSAGFYPAMSLTMVSLLIVWFSGGRDGLWLFVPALIALCALFARSINETTPYPRVLLISLVVVLTALGLSSVAMMKSKEMENFAERLRNYIADTLFFTEPRKVYTIQVDGYKPLETRLGGPAEVKERPVMTVETPTSVLLRGSIHNTYTGLSWGDTLSTRRYLYMDPRQRGVRADTLDENRPGEDIRSTTLFDAIDIKITMQSDSASTLFVPLRTKDLSLPMEMVPYFNASSEIFITRDLHAGDVYTLSAPIIDPTDARLPEILAYAAQKGERRDMTGYLNVPAEIAPDIRTLAQNLTEGLQAPLEKALAIQSHLKTSYRYTLIPTKPPDNQDFVSYFLLRGKEGYCTYFASAMAVLGRLAGLPTRYVEGYLAQPSGGVALVSSKNAHAWAEVYFDGFGWIAFDATPPDATRRAENNQGGGEQQQDDQNQNSDQGQQPEDATADPTPSAAPPEDSGADEEQDPPEAPDNPDDPSESPPPDDNSDDPSDTPTPPPTPTPSPTPSPPPEDNQPPEDTPPDQPPDKPSRWWLWLLLVIAAGLLTWRAVWTRPESVAGRSKGDDERLLLWYRALLGLLGAAGMGAKPSESPVAHALRLGEAVPEACGLLGVADAVTHLGYGRYGASPAQVQEARACYGAVHLHVPLKAKAVWFVRRMLHGIGSVKQVP